MNSPYTRKPASLNVYKKYQVIGVFLVLLSVRGSAQHLVSFCGEPVPMDQQFIQDKLINTIRKQVNVVNFPALRKRAFAYFPLVERYLAAYGLHKDLKYLPIVESGFLTEEESAVGAKGIWQIMPATARSYGLVIDETRDERENFDKATRLACTLIKDNYNMLIRFVGRTNWPLTIAAYNFGIGNIVKAVKAQGYNYFTMKLNPETALYVYKIIAVKELFEYPELYNSRFGYNIFNPRSGPKSMPAPKDLKVVNDPDVLQEIEKEVAKNANKKETVVREEYVMAHVLGRIRNFQDGDIVDIVLDEDLQTTRKGLSYKGYKFGVQGWIIDDRVYFKLGYDHDVTLLDTNKEKGILLTDLLANKRIDVLLKNLIYEK